MSCLSQHCWITGKRTGQHTNSGCNCLRPLPLPDQLELKKRIMGLESDLVEKQALFDMCHKRTIEADKLWQIAHNQPNVWPDLGKLVEWLLLRLKNQETIIEANRATVKAKDALIEALRMGKMSPCDYYTSKESEENLCRELAEARAEIDELNAEIERLKGVVISQITPEPLVLSHYSMTAEPAKDERDELVEQMKKLLKAVECSEFEGPICFDIDGKNWYDAREAALSAAERMEKK